MAWQGVVGHDDVVEQFRRTLSRNRLASTFLFVGPPGIGKRTFALKLAQTLLCSGNPPERMQPCEQCPSCIQAASGQHPDLIYISRPKDKSDIPVALLIGPPERRMQEGLCHDIALKPFMGGRRIAIIDDADFLNEEGANCLLKTLEEPPPQSVLILIGTSAEKQLPTIRSRSQIVRFAPLAPELLAPLLVEQQIAEDRPQAEQLARYSGGSLELARELADKELWAFRRNLLAALSRRDWDSTALAKDLIAFVEAAGKEAGPRRARLRQVAGFVADLYRLVARQISGAAWEADAELQTAVMQTSARWTADVETAGLCALRSLEAVDQIDRNANQNTLIECWLDDLKQIELGRLVEI